MCYFFFIKTLGKYLSEFSHCPDPIGLEFEGPKGPEILVDYKWSKEQSMNTAMNIGMNGAINRVMERVE